MKAIQFSIRLHEGTFEAVQAFRCAHEKAIEREVSTADAVRVLLDRALKAEESKKRKKKR